MTVRSIVCVALLAASVAGLSIARSSASGENPFDVLAGTWSGNGRVTLEGGRSEAISCTAYYLSKDAGSGMSLAIRCAGSSYDVEIRSNLRYANGRVSGDWEERTFNAAGSASGAARDGRLRLLINGAVSASITMAHDELRQSISIKGNGTGLPSIRVGFLRM